MNKKVDGLKAAVEMLQGLDLAHQQRLIADIARQDPELAVKLKATLVTFDDLQFLTAQMMPTFLFEIKLEDLALALRGASKELTAHLLSLMSKNNRSDLEEFLKGKPRPLSEVLEAQQKIMSKVIKLKDEGKIVLSKSGSEKLV